MIFKKITTFALGLLITAGLAAQTGNNEMHGGAKDGNAKGISFPASDIQFWTGTGSNQATYILGWDDDPSGNDTALVWGVRWNGTATATTLLDTIAAYDTRFNYTLSGSLMTDMSFNDGTINPGSSMNGWCYYHNGSWGMYAWPNQPMANGDVIEMSSSCLFTLNSATAVTDPSPTGTTDTVDATIDTSDIVFWVGNGTNRAVLIVNWGNPDTAFAWGFRFNGTVTAQTMVDSIAAADPRFWTVGTPSYNGDIHYILNNGDTLGLIPGPSTADGYNFWWANLNGVSAGSGSAETLHNGDVFKYGDYSVGIGWDPMGTYFLERAWPKTPTPAPLPTPTDTTTVEDATIDTADILYWVGTGSNKLTFVVNWADTALAWGYRFNTESVSMPTVLNDLAAADPRLTFGATGMLDDIWFVEDNDTLKITPGNYWEHSLNGNMSAGMGTTMHNGDFSRWADPAGGVAVDSFYYDGWGWFYTYAYPATIYPVSIPSSDDPVVDATIDTNDILYWVGTGANKLTFVVNWADTALAWGYRFNADSVLLSTVMDHIAEVDPRFRYTGTGMVSDINFITNGDTLGITPGNWWSHYLNGTTSAGMMQWMHSGDFSRWADPAAGVLVDSVYHEDWGGWWERIYVYPQTIYPVSEPAPVSDTITADEIEYWIGEGENEAIFVVNWADTALAWGYRFSDEEVSMRQMMVEIQANDPRFHYTTDREGDMRKVIEHVIDIRFVENGETHSGSNWEYRINGHQSSPFGWIEEASYSWMDIELIENNDFVRWFVPEAGVLVDTIHHDEGTTMPGLWVENVYIFPQEITPVSEPITEGPFCGIVGTEGCEAINFADNRIKAWATGCTVVRGSRNVSDPDAAPVDYGTEDAGVGPASDNTMNAVSLGDGGMATLTFEYPITNGEGYDFAVYENSFDDYFLELAFVEVSSDGETFVRFPATSLTQTHTQIGSIGQVDATFINNLAGKYRVGWGTPFDLEELRDSANLDINNITHVRIIDVVGSIDPQYGSYDAFGHLVNDPFPTVSYSGGFDLEGVCVLNQNITGIEEVSESSMKLYPNPANNRARLTIAPQANRNEAVLYDVTGRKVVAYTVEAGATGIELNTSTLANGVYMLRLGSEVMKLIVKH